ncbi:MAG: c-type cytochrome [Hylemonella sp.]
MAHLHHFFRSSLNQVLTMLLLLSSSQALAQTPPRLELCAACHGANGVSLIPNFPSLAGQPKIFLENQLVLIREGLRDIPQMKGTLDGLKDPELTALANHFSRLPPPPPAAGPVDATRYQRGKAVADGTRCGICHLPNFSGREQVPRLAGQQERFLLDVMKEFRDHPGPGRDTIMAASLYGLSNQQLEDLAHFLAHYK